MKLELRKASLPTHDARHLSGWALQYDKVTEIRTESGTFKEKLQKGCLDGIDLGQVKLWINHKENFDVQPDNFQLELRDEGLHFSCDVPDSTIGKWIMEEMENFTGMSFSFICEEERSEDDVRVIEKIAYLKEISLLHSIEPAYKDTKVCTKTKECPLEARAKQEAEEALNKEALAIGLKVIEEREARKTEAKEILAECMKKTN